MPDNIEAVQPLYQKAIASATAHFKEVVQARKEGNATFRDVVDARIALLDTQLKDPTLGYAANEAIQRDRDFTRTLSEEK